MTKTAEEIKKALGICANEIIYSCNECPYRDNEAVCVDSVEADALEYIKKLEAENAKLKAEADKIANKIIHCKDCVHAHFTSDGTRGFCEYWDDNKNDLTVKLCLQGDDFCPHGQRRKA